jgi:hypothetical protein
LENKYVALKVLSESDVLQSDWISSLNDESLHTNNQQHRYPASVDTQFEFVKKSHARGHPTWDNRTIFRKFLWSYNFEKYKLS